MLHFLMMDNCKFFSECQYKYITDVFYKWPKDNSYYHNYDDYYYFRVCAPTVYYLWLPFMYSLILRLHVATRTIMMIDLNKNI